MTSAPAKVGKAGTSGVADGGDSGPSPVQDNEAMWLNRRLITG